MGEEGRNVIDVNTLYLFCPCTVAVNTKFRNVTVVRCDYCAERNYVTLPGLQLRSANELLT